MEIPAGKWCEECRFLREQDIVDQDGDDRIAHSCSLFRDLHFPEVDEYCDYTPTSDEPLRHSRCLSAYPHGATVTITPKEAS